MTTVKSLLFVAFNSMFLFFSCAQTQEKRECTCSASGDPHYQTFDGQMIHFMGTCKYTLATNEEKEGRTNPIFKVEVKNEYRGTSVASYTRMIDVKFENITVRLLPKHEIMVNSEIMSLPINESTQFVANYSSGWINIYTYWGFHVRFDGNHRVIVTISNTTGGFTGICGDCNGKMDDFKTKDGQDVSNEKDLYALIGDSYKVNDDSDKPETKCYVKDVTPNCSTTETEKCDFIKHHDIFSVCTKKLTEKVVSEYYESCQIDVCAYHNDIKQLNSVLCHSFEGVAMECEKIGITVDWRKIAKCEWKCGPNEEYKFQAFICQPTCVNPVPKCTAHREACVCKPGFVLSSTGCVRKEQCGCVYKGRYMQVNEHFYNAQCSMTVTCAGSNNVREQVFPPCGPNSRCALEKGIRKCVCDHGFEETGGKCIPKNKLPCVCTGHGDPHYQLFDGQWINFAGICKYQMAKTKAGSKLTDFTIEVKNERHQNNEHYSYTRFIEVRFKQFTVKLMQHNKVMINGKMVSPPILTHASFTIIEKSGWVELEADFGLHIKFNGKTHFVITLSPSYRDYVTGVCGDCNGQKDDYKTKEGIDVSSKPDKFNMVVNSYQVADDSVDSGHICNKQHSLV